MILLFTDPDSVPEEFEEKVYKCAFDVGTRSYTTCYVTHFICAVLDSDWVEKANMAAMIFFFFNFCM